MRGGSGPVPWGKVLAGGACAGALAAFCLPISNPDLFWHLSAGRWMAENLALPRADWLSYTMEGRPWADFEWLVQTVYYGVWRVTGLGGLWLVKILTLCAGAGLMWRILGLYGVRPAARGLGVLAWALGLTSANDLRPENVSIVLFLAALGFLEARRLGKIRSSARAQAAGAVVFFAFWANIHAGFLYGLILAGAYGLIDVIRPAGTRRSWLLPGLCALGAGGALINPYGLRIYVVPWEHWAAMADLKVFIREWTEPSLRNAWHWPFWALLFCSYGAAILRYVRRRDVPLEHLAALALFGLSASSHARTGVYLVCVAVPVTTAALGAFDWAKRRAGLDRALLAAGFSLAWAFFALFIVKPLSFMRAFDDKYAPGLLVEFLENEKGVLGGRRMLNPWHWGGYLGFRLSPDHKVFVDGRYLFHGLLRPMHEATRAPDKYAAFLDEHGVEFAVLERGRRTVSTRVPLKRGGSVIVERPSYLFFLPKRDWALVHWDPAGRVFARRSAFDAEWIGSREYRHFRPRDLRAAYLKVQEGFAAYEEVEAEVERYVSVVGEGAQADAARRWLRSVKEAPALLN